MKSPCARSPLNPHARRVGAVSCPMRGPDRQFFVYLRFDRCYVIDVTHQQFVRSRRTRLWTVVNIYLSFGWPVSTAAPRTRTCYFAHRCPGTDGSRNGKNPRLTLSPARGTPCPTCDHISTVSYCLERRPSNGRPERVTCRF